MEAGKVGSAFEDVIGSAPAINQERKVPICQRSRLEQGRIGEEFFGTIEHSRETTVDVEILEEVGHGQLPAENPVRREEIRFVIYLVA